MSPSSRGVGAPPARAGLLGAALGLLSLSLLACGARAQSAATLEVTTQLPTISIISNIGGYGWQPGFPCNQIAGAAIKCDNQGFVVALDLPATQGAYLTGAIGNLTRLTSLILDNNAYSDVLPASIGNLKNLRILNLRNNLFTGSLPATMSALTLLKDLDLSRNFFTGPVPQGVQKLTSLTRVRIAQNYFTGKVHFAPPCGAVDVSANCLANSTPCTKQDAQRAASDCTAACKASVWKGSTAASCKGGQVCTPMGSETGFVVSDWTCL